MFNLRNKKKKGFTLIELIVVIAILGILAAIAIPRFVGFQDNANARANEANIATLRSAAELAVANNGNPAAAVTWTALADGAGAWNAGNFLSTWPNNPVGAAYSVTIATDGTITITP